MQSMTELFDGELTGLSSIRRVGTTTVDKVADWTFLYTNIGLKDIKVGFILF